MFRSNAKLQAPYPVTQHRSRPEPFPPRATPTDHFSGEPFLKRRRAPDDDYDSLERPVRASYSSNPIPSRAVQYSGSGSYPVRDTAYRGPAHHTQYDGFGEPRGQRVFPAAVPPRGRRLPQASSASASLPGLSSILQSSASPPPQQQQQQQYQQRPMRRADAPPISAALANHSSRLSHQQQRTTSWSSNGSPHESPLVSRSAASGGVRGPQWESAVAAEARQHDMRDAYGAAYYHQHQQHQRLGHAHHGAGRDHALPTRVGNGHTSPSSSLASEELLETAETEPIAVAANGNKNSRYLREMDRRAILERLANGEKQAALAKEFQVSRAAICNLNKHRDEVMSRSDENPFAKHPKKRKVRATAVSLAKPTAESSSATASTVDDEPMPATKADHESEREPVVLEAVHVVQSRAVQLLMTTLRSHTTPLTAFRRCSERMLRLMLEDALALVPTTPVDVFLNDQVKVEGVGRQHAPCGISLEQRHCPMMDMFHVIEPDQPTGYVRLTRDDVTLLDAHLPASLTSHNVFLLDLVAASSETLCATLAQLKRRGAVESRLYVVALFVASEVITAVQCTFPRVHIVTAQIDASLNASQNNKALRRGGASTGSLDGLLTRFAQVYNDRV